jgi:hypothetical protein
MLANIITSSYLLNMTISKEKKELKIYPNPPKILMISKLFSSSKYCNFLGKIS